MTLAAVQTRAPVRALPVYFPPATAALLALDRNGCHWPLGEVEDDAFRFCGAPRAHGAYCGLHGRLSARRAR